MASGFEKESANEGRIRLAIDAAAAGIGTVKRSWNRSILL